MKNWFLRSRAFLVFLPVIAVLCWAAGRDLGVGVLASLLGLGLLAWTLIEWLAHRAMHADVNIAWISRLQDEAHLRHHREPDDLEHSVVHLTASIPISGLLLTAAWLIGGSWPHAWAWTAGVLLGYMLYEFVHLTSHGGPRTQPLRMLHSYHLRHHFQQSDRGFGVTSPLWDWVFSTMPARHPSSNSDAPPSRRVTN
jgi:sterol desaturase/sphingolipid hydroxylase (fatty acid hydroxylase superfamily)